MTFKLELEVERNQYAKKKMNLAAKKVSHTKKNSKKKQTTCIFITDYGISHTQMVIRARTGPELWIHGDTDNTHYTYMAHNRRFSKQHQHLVPLPHRSQLNSTLDPRSRVRQAQAPNSSHLQTLCLCLCKQTVFWRTGSSVGVSVVKVKLQNRLMQK